MSWNSVLNIFCEIQEKVIEAGMDLWAYDKGKETCMDYWSRMLGEEKYENLISNLEIMEHNDFLLVRYGNYSDVLSGSEDVTMETFWDLYDGFYRECRSVVIDIKKNALVLTPFRKFRNLNEAEETSYENIKKRIAEASCVEISDKLDGSMQSARYYEGKIVMAGSQSLNKENSWRLADGYQMLMQNEGYQRMLKENADKTFIFEYISQKDAHVVKYDTEGLFLIGVRDVRDGSEASYNEVLKYAVTYNVQSTRMFEKTLDQLIEELDDKRSDEAEGFVMNIDGFKVKIKYNDYVYMHKMLSLVSSVNVIIESIAEERFDDLIAKIPNAYKGRVMKVANIVFDYMRNVNKVVNDAYERADKENIKAFMIWVSENVDRQYQGYVRCKYLGQGYNVLKRNGGYMKLKEMGVEDYTAVA